MRLKTAMYLFSGIYISAVFWLILKIQGFVFTVENVANILHWQWFWDVLFFYQEVFFFSLFFHTIKATDRIFRYIHFHN